MLENNFLYGVYLRLTLNVHVLNAWANLAGNLTGKSGEVVRSTQVAGAKGNRGGKGVKRKAIVHPGTYVSYLFST